MGCYNATCFITGQQIIEEDDAVLFIINLPGKSKNISSFFMCDENKYVSTPIFGKYNGYGNLGPLKSNSEIETKDIINIGKVPYPVDQDALSANDGYYALCHRKAYDIIMSSHEGRMTVKRLDQLITQTKIDKNNSFDVNPLFNTKLLLQILELTKNTPDYMLLKYLSYLSFSIQADLFDNEEITYEQNLEIIVEYINYTIFLKRMDKIGRVFYNASYLQVSDNVLLRDLLVLTEQISSKKTLTEDNWLYAYIPDIEEEACIPKDIILSFHPFKEYTIQFSPKLLKNKDFIISPVCIKDQKKME